TSLRTSISLHFGILASQSLREVTFPDDLRCLYISIGYRILRVFNNLFSFTTFQIQLCAVNRIVGTGKLMKTIRNEKTAGDEYDKWDSADGMADRSVQQLYNGVNRLTNGASPDLHDSSDADHMQHSRAFHSPKGENGLGKYLPGAHGLHYASTMMGNQFPPERYSASCSIRTTSITEKIRYTKGKTGWKKGRRRLCLGSIQSASGCITNCIAAPPPPHLIYHIRVRSRIGRERLSEFVIAERTKFGKTATETLGMLVQVYSAAASTKYVELSLESVNTMFQSYEMTDKGMFAVFSTRI
ncbi:hypothetical protein C0J52_17472, partial [Blattella germanica]